jgi:UDP-N-acetylglucosamine--N-acetylmuramyl-(pentapeptide) pyrophosphoryl-undecaprenol N-acetylglucosamine transferase
VGTARGLETRLVPEAGFRLELIPVGQLKNVSLAIRLRTLLDLPVAFVRCTCLLRSFRADVVVGVGGYASGPAMGAALLWGVPTLAFEPNAVPGLANRLVARFVSAAAVNFEPALRYFRGGKVTGIPVRTEFFAIRPVTLRSEARLLVFGGSQGARVLNTVMPLVIPSLLEAVPGLQVLHQSGARHAEATRAAYAASGADPSRWRVEEYLDDMPSRFAEATLILCRSGASTVAELAAAGRAAVLVPFPGAAKLLVQGTDQQLAETLQGDLKELLLDLHRCAVMGERARSLAYPRAAQSIAEMILGLVGR